MLVEAQCLRSAEQDDAPKYIPLHLDPAVRTHTDDMAIKDGELRRNRPIF